MKKLNELYNRITPETSSKELAEKIINMPEEKVKKIRFRPVTAVIAAAVAVSAMTFTVGAANNWDYESVFSDYGKAFRELFSTNSAISKEKVARNTSANKDTFDWMDIEVSAIAADKQGALIVLDYYATGDVTFTQTMMRDYCPFPYIEGISTSSGSGVVILDKGHAQVTSHISFNNEDITGKELIIEVDSYNNPEEIWSTSFVINNVENETAYEPDCEIAVHDRYYTPDAPTLVEYEQETRGVIKKVVITPISVYFYSDSLDLRICMAGDRIEKYLLLENGERVEIIAGTGTSDVWDYSHHGLWNPVNPEEVVAAVIDGNEIRLK